MPKLDSQLAAQFIDRIYETAFDVAQWGPLLDDLARIYDGRVALFMQDLRHGDTQLAEFRAFDPSFVSSYITYYGARSPWIAELGRLPAGTVVTEAMLSSRDDLEQSEFYHDWLRPQGLYSAVGVILEKTGTVATNLAINKAAKRGPVAPEEVEFLALLAPHIRRALRIHRQLGAERLERSAAFDALATLGTGMVIASSEARVIFANSGAEHVLRAADALSVQEGKLAGRTPAATASLRAAIRAATATAAQRETWPGADRNGGFGNDVVQLPKHGGDVLPVLVGPPCGAAAWQLLPTDGPAALLFMRLPCETGSGFNLERLQKLYCLTAAEARLVAALLPGGSLNSYAEASGVTLNTVKTQLKQVFEKTGEHRQADLVRRLLLDPLIRLT